MSRATKETEAGRRYLDLQRMAKHTGKPTDEPIQLYALEGFLDRLARSVYADQFVLKGGVLLAALDARRPTRDIDLAAQGLDNSAEHVLLLIREIAAIAIGDGLVFNAENATAETIRDDGHYSGSASLSAEHCRVPPFVYTWTSTWVTRFGLSRSKSDCLDYLTAPSSFEAIRWR